jgi:hypothetical protein
MEQLGDHFPVFLFFNFIFIISSLTTITGVVRDDLYAANSLNHQCKGGWVTVTFLSPLLFFHSTFLAQRFFLSISTMLILNFFHHFFFFISALNFFSFFLPYRTSTELSLSEHGVLRALIVSITRASLLIWNASQSRAGSR